MTATRESIREAFIAAGFSSIVDDLEPLMKDAIGIITEIKHDDQEIPVGASKLGGAPDLPTNKQWPYWQEGEPLSFICQLNLAEVTQYDVHEVLPASGMLYFFCDVEDDQGVPPVGLPQDKGRWKFIYFDGDFSELRRLPLPLELLRNEHFAPHVVTFQYQVTIPSFHIHRRSYSIAHIEIMDSEDQSDTVFESLCHAYDQLWPFPVHRLLGHPNEIQQTDMRIMCQLASNGRDPWSYKNDPQSIELLTRINEWQLLWQIDSTIGYSEKPCGDGGMCWGDAGLVYLWMREQDLRAKKFENAWLTLQDM